ncbi:fatty acid desaturase family protein [Spirosoma endophyticum]|uniref:Fatty acid desaturase n=1 Tax=Spirosoma endophyticum TaxID=662367 RepID=A0A1I2E9B6_9BACT|nr:fatty acid desaturase [Spirosoma endophyticum]SFE89267.1 Fatty acid desaturase [Spirosoma endophyticum]
MGKSIVISAGDRHHEVDRQVSCLARFRSLASSVKPATFVSMANSPPQRTTSLKISLVRPSLFFSTARQRVDAYFTQHGLLPHTNSIMWQKSQFFLFTYRILFGLIIANLFGVQSLFGLAVLLGLWAGFVGFNVSHDAIHGAFSARGWVNQLLSTCFFLLGVSPYVWRTTHTVIHHTYTNIPGHDEDI